MPPICAYNALVRDHYGVADLDAIIQEVAVEGTQWVNNTMFQPGALKTEAKFWYEFIRHYIMPTMNKLKVTKDRAILIYAILQKMEVDIVQLIYSALQTQIQRISGELSGDDLTIQLKKKANFIFPSLISALYERNSMKQFPDEELDTPGIILEYIRKVRKPKGNKRPRPTLTSGEGSSRQSQGTVLPQSTSDTTLTHEIAQIRLGQSMMLANMQLLAQYELQLMIASDISIGRPADAYPVVLDFLPLPTAFADEPIIDPVDLDEGAEEPDGAEDAEDDDGDDAAEGDDLDEQ